MANPQAEAEIVDRTGDSLAELLLQGVLDWRDNVLNPKMPEGVSVPPMVEGDESVGNYEDTLRLKNREAQAIYDWFSANTGSNVDGGTPHTVMTPLAAIDGGVV